MRLSCLYNVSMIPGVKRISNDKDILARRGVTRKMGIGRAQLTVC